MGKQCELSPRAGGGGGWVGRYSLIHDISHIGIGRPKGRGFWAFLV